MIVEKIDVANIIYRLNELEKLKLLLFDEDQLHIFEHIPKPYLVNKKAMKQEGKQDLEGIGGILVRGSELWNEKHVNEEERIQNFAKSLENLRNKETLNAIDKKLLELVRLYHE